MMGLCQSVKYSAPSGPISKSAGRKFGSLDDTIGSTSVAAEAGAFVGDLVLQNALKTDHVADQQVALHLVGKMAARKILDARTGPRPRLVNHRRSLVLVGKVDVA